MTQYIPEIIIYNFTFESMYDINKIHLLDPKILIIRNINLKEEFPNNIYRCKKLEKLILDNCHISTLNEKIKNLNLRSIELPNNKIRHFPEILLEIETLEMINLDFNKITFLPEFDYRNITVSLRGQYINKIPSHGGNFPGISALYADIDNIINENYNDYEAGPSPEWRKRNGNIIKKCCNSAKFYTRRGDRILNSCLRRGFLLPEIRPFYNDLINSSRMSLQIPEHTLMFRGIECNIISDVSVGSTIIDNGFSSFSFSLNVAKRFSNKIIIFQPKTKFNGIYFDIDEGTSYYDEKEILLGPGLRLRVTEIKKVEKYTYFITEFGGYNDISEIIYNDYNINLKFDRLMNILENQSTDGFIIDGVFYPNKLYQFINNEYLDFKIHGISAFEKSNSTFYKLLLHILGTIELHIVSGELELLKISGRIPKIKLKNDAEISDIKYKEIIPFIEDKLLESWYDHENIKHNVTYSNTIIH